MARKLTRKQLKKDEFIDSLYFAGAWLETHWKTVALSAATIALAGAALAGVFWLREKRLEQAETLLSTTIARLEKETRGESVMDPEKAGEFLEPFRQVQNLAGGRPVAEVAALYEARVLLAAGRAREAEDVLERLVEATEDPVLAGTARALLARAAEAAGDTDRAEAVWRELASAPEDVVYPADLALLELARLLEREGRRSEAREVLSRLENQYPQSPWLVEARRLLTRASG